MKHTVDKNLASEIGHRVSKANSQGSLSNDELSRFRHEGEDSDDVDLSELGSGDDNDWDQSDDDWDSHFVGLGRV